MCVEPGKRKGVGVEKRVMGELGEKGTSARGVVHKGSKNSIMTIRTPVRFIIKPTLYTPDLHYGENKIPLALTSAVSTQIVLNYVWILWISNIRHSLNIC